MKPCETHLWHSLKQYTIKQAAASPSICFETLPSKTWLFSQLPCQAFQDSSSCHDWINQTWLWGLEARKGAGSLSATDGFPRLRDACIMLRIIFDMCTSAKSLVLNERGCLSVASQRQKTAQSGIKRFIFVRQIITKKTCCSCFFIMHTNRNKKWRLPLHWRKCRKPKVNLGNYSSGLENSPKIL